MNTLHIYDPAMCCSSGVCGPQVDPALVRFAADLKWLGGSGVEIQRYNLAQSPGAFAENQMVRAALAEKGEAVLPILVVNGSIAATGRYPDRHELASWFKINSGKGQKIALGSATGECCGGNNCC